MLMLYYAIPLENSIYTVELISIYVINYIFKHTFCTAENQIEACIHYTHTI